MSEREVTENASMDFGLPEDAPHGACPLEPITSYQGSYRWLSNFYPCVVAYEGVEYPTTEHAYQATKTLNIDHRRAISVLPTPYDAKREGGNVFLRPGWRDMKLQVMRELIDLKFSQPFFMRKLLETNGRELIEGNNHGDRFYGQSPLGQGRNELGKLQMEKRDRLLACEKALTEGSSRAVEVSRTPAPF